MAIFWPRVTFFISKCIYGLKLNDIRTFWNHLTTFGSLKQVFKKLVFEKFFEKSVTVRGGGRIRPKIFLNFKSIKSGPKCDIFNK